jgi:PAT family beta-lactamase induction signal transducer AmpG
MTEKSPAKKTSFSYREIFSSLKQKPMALALLMGFSSGFPLLLSSKTLQTWIAYAGGTNTTVGAMAILGVPYSLKFLWAPLLDRYSIGPFGRRRGWLLISQLGVALSIFGLSRLNPVDEIFIASFFALGISFFGATQDIVIDAYRRETLKEEELGLGSAISNSGYRVALWVTGGLAIFMAGEISWNTIFALLALMMMGTWAITFWADEPTSSASAPRTLRDAVYLPLIDFFSRHGAVLMLIFVLLYKVGDSMAGNMLAKFYVHLGFTPQEVGAIAKTMGPIALTVGTFIGGALIYRFGIYRALFAFGVLQALSTISFVALDFAGHSLAVFSAVIFFEDFSSGMGSAAFMAFMASLTNKKFTGTQYALLTSLMAVPRTFIASFTGPMVDALGWTGFFILCALIALPGLILIRYVYRLTVPAPTPSGGL